MPKTQHAEYENNPLRIGLDGVKLFFTNAQSIAIYSVVISVVILVSIFGLIVATVAMTANMSESAIAAMDAEDAAAWKNFIRPSTPADVLIPVAREVGSQFVSLVISLLLFGVLDYAAARMAAGQKASLGEAFKQVFTQFPGYLWLYVLMSIKLFLWSLLFIVPGFFMFYRYSLAGTIFFSGEAKGNAALKRSADLTKGRWLTTFAGTSIWPLITQGMGYYVFTPGSLAILYRQYSASDKRVPAHWLSWATLLTPILLVVLLVMLVVLVVLMLSNLPAST